jgi:large subunit ribosomal protein L10
MKMDRAKKQEFVDELAGKLAAAQCVYLTDFTGLDVERLTQLRSRLRAASVDYVVVKNTLARRAIAGTAAEPLDGLLEGPTAFAVSAADVVAAARALTDFSKDTDLPRIKGGVIAGRIVGHDEIRRLATLPGREVLLGRVAGSMKSPIGGLVFVLAGIVGKFVRTVDALRVQKAEREGADSPQAAGEAGAGRVPEEAAAPAAEPALEVSVPPEGVETAPAPQP